MRLHQHRVLRILPLISVLLVGTPAAAGELFATGNFTIAGNTFESGGYSTTNPNDPFNPDFYFPNRGDDSDSAWVLGGSIGYAVPVNELAPLDWDWPLSDWKLGLEFEGKSGGDTEYITQGLDPYISTVFSWQFMNNLWLDVPLDAPVRWWLGRTPFLDPISFNLMAGVGLAGTEIKTTNNVFAGKTEDLGFAWQAGGGFGYRLTDRVTLGVGYRYLDLGSHSFKLRSGGFPDPLGKMEVDLVSHQLTFGLRVAFLDVPSPGEWGELRSRPSRIDWSRWSPRNWFKRN